MGAAEVEMRHLQRNRQFVIAERFRESHRFAGASAIEQAQAQVATL